MPARSGGSPLGASAPALPLPLRLIACAVAAVLLFPAVGCGLFRHELQHTLDSPQAVAEAVVAALDRKDIAALERLAVSELEFQRLVWPRQPAARPERNIPWEYAWRDLASKSRLQLRGRIAEWQPGPLTVVDISFDGDTTDYETYRVLRKSKVTLRDAAGRRTTARLFGSVIEQQGHFKVFSYVVD
jgi:hypothetical protein